MNILLTSSGRRSYLVDYFREALDGKGLVHASNSTWSSALEVADKAVITPLIYSDNYIDFLLDYCKKNEINVIVSLFDIDLPILALSKKRFLEAGVRVIVSDYEVTDVCNDKWKSFLFLNEHHINTPKTYIELDSALRDINEKIINYPVIIKPRWGMGSILVFRADNEEELRVLYAKVKREINDSFVKYESQSDPEHTVLIQEYVHGQEYGLDVVNDLEKRYVATFAKKKLEMRSGETYSAVTIQNDLLEDLGNRIGEKLGHIANLDTDCIIHNEVPYVLDMNCRFGGLYPFSHFAGVNLPKAIISWIEGAKTENLDNLFKYELGLEGYKDMVIRTCNSTSLYASNDIIKGQEEVELNR